MHQLPKILFVDDDEKLTFEYQQYFAQKFNVYTAASAEAAFSLAEKDGPFAVVVSNINMPDMSGVAFLYKYRKFYPNTRRIIVSATKHDETLLMAINKARVYHFLSKPCPLGLLEVILNKAVRRFEYITAEHDIIEHVTAEVVKSFSDILAMTNPVAFTRTSRIAVVVSQTAKILKLPRPERYETAARLSQIGAVAIPPATMDKMYNNVELGFVEVRMLRDLPAKSAALIRDIPKMEDVAEMVNRQNDDFTGPPMPPIPKVMNEKGYEVLDKTYNPYDPKNLTYLGDIQKRDPLLLGAELLRAAIDLEKFIGIGYELNDAVEELKFTKGKYNPLILVAFKGVVLPEPKKKILSVAVTELNKWMQFEEDVCSKSGALLASRGKSVNAHISELFNKYYEQHNIQETVKVSIPYFPE